MKMVSNSSPMEERKSVSEKDSGALNSEAVMDQYLQSIGLYRKPVAKDGSCLFRAVAEKIYLTQAKHLDVRYECIQFMKENSSLFREFVPGSFEHHLFDLQNPKEWAGQVEITALSMLYKHDIVVYQEINQPPQHVTANGFKDKIVLCFSNGNHYDCIYPRSFKENAAIVQSLLYGHLCGVILPECEKRDAMKVNSTEDPSSGDGNEGVDAKSKTGKENDVTIAESSVVSWELKRSLDSSSYRNVALEVWEQSKQDQAHSDKLFATKLQFRIGEYCLLQMADSKSAGEFLKVRIDDINESTLTYYVWIVEHKEHCYVSIDCLRPLLENASEKQAQIAYNELPGYYNKSEEVFKEQTENFQYPKKRQKGNNNRNNREDEVRGKKFDSRSDMRNEGKVDGRGEGPIPNRRDSKRDRRGTPGGDRGAPSGERSRNERHNNEKRGRAHEKGSKKPDTQRVTSPNAVPAKPDGKHAGNEKAASSKKAGDKEGVSQEEPRSSAEYPTLKPQGKEKTAKTHESSAAFWQRMRETAKPGSGNEKTILQEENAETTNTKGKDDVMNQESSGGKKSYRGQRDLEASRTKAAASKVTTDKKHIDEETTAMKLMDDSVDVQSANKNVSLEATSVDVEKNKPAEEVSNFIVTHLPNESTKEIDVDGTEQKPEDQRNIDGTSFESGETRDFYQGNRFVNTLTGETNEALNNESLYPSYVESDTSSLGQAEANPYFQIDGKVSFPSAFDVPINSVQNDFRGYQDENNETGSPITFMSSHSDISVGSDDNTCYDFSNPIGVNAEIEMPASGVGKEEAAHIMTSGNSQFKGDSKNEQRIRILKKDNRNHFAYFSSPSESISSSDPADSVSRERSPEPDSKRAQGKKVSFGEVTEISQVSNEPDPYVSVNSQPVVPNMMQNSYLNANGIAEANDQLYYDESGNYNPAMGMPTQVMPLMMHNPLQHPNEQIHIPQAFSMDPEGKDLPNHIPTLRYFFNLGLQFFYMQPQTPAYINMPMQQMPPVQMQPQQIQSHMPSQIQAQRFAPAVDPTAQFNAEQEEYIAASSAAPIHYDFIHQQPLNQARQHQPQGQNSASQYEQPPRMRRGRGRGSDIGPRLSISRGYNMYNHTQQKPQYRVGKRGGFNVNATATGQSLNQSYSYH